MLNPPLTPPLAIDMGPTVNALILWGSTRSAELRIVQSEPTIWTTRSWASEEEHMFVRQTSAGNHLSSPLNSILKADCLAAFGTSRSRSEISCKHCRN